MGPATGRMLHLLATGANAKSILELGTSCGYSTIWLADAARATGGKVVSLELSQRKVDHAQAQLARVGLADFVEFRVGSGVELSRKARTRTTPVTFAWTRPPRVHLAGWMFYG